MTCDNRGRFWHLACMARHPRIHVPDGWSHGMSHGNGGEALCRTEEGRRRFLGLVAELPERFGADEFVDSDGDGLADDWERRYGLNPQRA